MKTNICNSDIAIYNKYYIIKYEHIPTKNIIYDITYDSNNLQLYIL